MLEENLSGNQTHLLKIVAGHASEDATEMFSKWLRQPVHIKMDRVEFMPFETVCAMMETREENAIGVLMSIDKGIEGMLLFLFSEDMAFKMIDLLTKQKIGTTSELGDLERSALNETANIVGCAYLNSLKKSLSVECIPSTPILIHDMPLAIMNAVLMEQAAFQDESLFINTEFFHDGGKLDFQFFFLPVFESLKERLG
ncbi:MAG: hypothetical protein H7A33_03900 [Deltaproteobacteria bacterium]|nr:hypothetical protein [Deltaproteobacteria bacterium]